ncbi:MAG: hypothetical protein ABIU95_03860 [Burkholderiales bacterium]
MRHRSLWIKSILGVCFTIVASLSAAQAEQYSARAVRIIVPFPPGGLNDLGSTGAGGSAHLISEWLHPLRACNS